MLNLIKDKWVQTSVAKISVTYLSFTTTNIQVYSSQRTIDLTQKKRLTYKPFRYQQGKKASKQTLSTRLPSVTKKCWGGS